MAFTNQRRQHTKNSPSDDSIAFITSALNNNSPPITASLEPSPKSPPSSPPISSPSAQDARKSKRLPSSRQTLSSQLFSSSPAKKKSLSILNFLAIKEPSTQALLEYEQSMRKHQQTPNGDRPSAAGMAMVSAAKMPSHVPKVNSKWEGVPKAVLAREREKDRRSRMHNSPSHRKSSPSSDTFSSPSRPLTRSTSSSTVPRGPTRSVASRDSAIPTPQSVHLSGSSTLPPLASTRAPSPAPPASKNSHLSLLSIPLPLSPVPAAVLGSPSSIPMPQSPLSTLQPPPTGLETWEPEAEKDHEIYQPLPRIIFMNPNRSGSPALTSSASTPPDLSPVTPHDPVYTVADSPFVPSSPQSPAFPSPRSHTSSSITLGPMTRIHPAQFILQSDGTKSGPTNLAYQHTAAPSSARKIASTLSTPTSATQYLSERKSNVGRINSTMPATSPLAPDLSKIQPEPSATDSADGAPDKDSTFHWNSQQPIELKLGKTRAALPTHRRGNEISDVMTENDEAVTPPRRGSSSIGRKFSFFRP